VVVENVGGAGASIGSDRIAKAAPDGYTIGLATTGSHAINPHIYGAKAAARYRSGISRISRSAVSYVNVAGGQPQCTGQVGSRSWSPTRRPIPAR
jgi:tripartite-type tricarboxylate transporter receptor subunit TctC